MWVWTIRERPPAVQPLDSIPASYGRIRESNIKLDLNINRIGKSELDSSHLSGDPVVGFSEDGNRPFSSTRDDSLLNQPSV
jgi:hypothetical protein